MEMSDIVIAAIDERNTPVLAVSKVAPVTASLAIGSSTASPGADFQIQNTPQNEAAAGSSVQVGQGGVAGSKEGSAAVSSAAESGGSSSAVPTGGAASTTIVNESTVAHANGSVTTTLTYADGSTSVSTSEPDHSKATYAYTQEQKIENGGIPHALDSNGTPLTNRLV